MWFAVAGKVPAKGTALLVTLSEGSRDTTYPGVFIELTAPRKLRTNAGETKAMQPVNLTIALLLSDDQHNHLVNQHTLPRVSQLEVLPGGASTPLWDALLHMPMSLLEYRWRTPHWKRFASRIGCRTFSRTLCLFCSPDWLSKGIGMTRGPILSTR